VVAGGPWGALKTGCSVAVGRALQRLCPPLRHVAVAQSILVSARPVAPPPVRAACRDGAAWRVSTLAAVARVEAAPMRQAGSALPPAVLADIDARIDGPSLDVQAERQARAQGWR